MLTDKEYVVKLEKLVNISSIIHGISTSKNDDSLMTLPDDLYEYILKPQEIRYDKRIGHIVDYEEPSVLKSIMRAESMSAQETIDFVLRFLVERLGSLVEIYRKNKTDPEEAMYYVQLFYVVLLKIYVLTVSSFQDVSDIDFIQNRIDALDFLADETANRIHENKIKRNVPYNQIQAELKQLKQSYRALNKQYGHEIKNHEKDREEHEKQFEEYSRDREELASLRELVFSLRKETEEPETAAVSFPVRTAGNIYCLGGQTSWINRMKELAPDVKYINSDQNIKLDDKLDKADQIWFQINGLSHAQFYTATAIADKNNVPIKYFTFQSPALCAEQLSKTVSLD